MSTQPSFLQIRAAWERSTLNTTRDETALMLTVTAHRSRSSLTSNRAPVDVAFVLDRSGSMQGDKIELVKAAVDQAINHLGPDDRVALVIFDNEIDVLQPLAPASPTVRAAMRHSLRQVQARGGTNLSDGWLTGCRELAETFSESPDKRLRRAILLTDGQANHGITDPSELATHAAALRQRGISTTTLGVGHGYDENLLAGMAEAGGGNTKYIGHPGELAEIFNHELGGLVDIAAVRPQIDLTLPNGLRALMLNAFPCHREGKTITVELRDLVAGDEVQLIFVVTHHGRIDASSTSLRCAAQAVEPRTGQREAFAVDIPRLVYGSEAEAQSAPLDPLVVVTRALEQASLDQREALRLDRQGRYAESRAMFNQSANRLTQAGAFVMSVDSDNIPDEVVIQLREESARSSELASAPTRPLREDIHKERTAYRSNHSRGSRPRDPASGK